MEFVGLDTAKSILELNARFPSLVENEGRLSTDPQNMIILNIVKNANDIDDAKEIAKNYYLLLQVMMSSKAIDYDNLIYQINTFLNLKSTTKKNIYEFSTGGDEFIDMVNIGLNKMFPTTFLNKIDTEFITGIVLNMTAQTATRTAYNIDKLGKLIEDLVVTELLNQFPLYTKQEIENTFKTNDYNINITYHNLAYSSYIKAEEQRKIDEGNVQAKLAEHEKEKRASQQFYLNLENLRRRFPYLDKNVISDKLIENKNNLDQTVNELQSLSKKKKGGISLSYKSSGGQYYKKRKTRKPSKIRKTRKTRKPKKPSKIRKTKKNPKK
jgi:hypothetical protein